jgi:photosystem II stability/assembly factor-like uncharacterized protein
MPYALAFVDGELVAGLADGAVLATTDLGDSWRAVARAPRILAFA